MVVTVKNRDDAGKVIRNLPEEMFSSATFTEKNIGGSGNSRTKLISFKDAIELIMVLPCKVAKETRIQSANVIRHYMAGDSSLHAEIQSNAESASPIAQVARASLDNDPADQQSLTNKRKREELEILSPEQDLRAKKHETLSKS